MLYLVQKRFCPCVFRPAWYPVREKDHAGQHAIPTLRGSALPLIADSHYSYLHSYFLIGENGRQAGENRPGGI